MDKYKIMQVDAYGNKEDGYERNDYYTVGEIVLEKYDTISICKVLNEIGIYLDGRKVKSDNYCESCIDILENKSDRPIFELQLVY